MFRCNGRKKPMKSNSIAFRAFELLVLLALTLLATLAITAASSPAIRRTADPLTAEEERVLLADLESLAGMTVNPAHSKIVLATNAASAEAAFRNVNAAILEQILPGSSLSGVVTMGGQSAGKSALNELFLGVPLVFSSDETATRCPVYYHADSGCFRGQQEGQDPLVTIIKPNSGTGASPAMSLRDAAQSITAFMLDLNSRDEFLKDPLYVHAYMCRKEFLSSFMLDLPGVMGVNANTLSPTAQQKDKIVYDLNSHVLEQHVFAKNSKNVLVIAHRIMDDYKSANWAKLLQGKELDYSRIAVAITFGNNQLMTKVDDHKFDACKSWADVEKVLFGEFRERLNPDIKIFVTTASAMDSKTFWDRVKATSYEAAVKEKGEMLAAGKKNLLDAVDRIGDLPNMKGVAGKEAFVAKYIGTDKLITHVKLSTVQSFRDGLEQLSRLMTRVAELNVRDRLVNLRRLEDADVTVGKRVEEIVQTITTLIQERWTGSGQANLRHSERPDQHSSALNDQVMRLWNKWIAQRRFNAEQDFEFAGSDRAPTPIDRGAKTPFPFDETDDSQYHKEATAWFQHFLKSEMVSGMKKGDVVGRLRTFSRSVFSGLFKVRAPTISDEDLQDSQENAFSSSINLEKKLFDTLHRYFEAVVRERFVPFVAQHFAALWWSASSDALNFLANERGEPMLKALAPGAQLSLALQLTEIFQRLYFDEVYGNMTVALYREVDNVNSMPDHASLRLAGMTALVIQSNEKRNFEWVCAHPNSPSALHQFAIHSDWKLRCAARMHNKDANGGFTATFVPTPPAAADAPPVQPPPKVEAPEDAPEPDPNAMPEGEPEASDVALAEPLKVASPDQFGVDHVTKGMSPIVKFFAELPHYDANALSAFAWSLQINDGIDSIPLPLSKAMKHEETLPACNEWLERHFRYRLWVLAQAFHVLTNAQIAFLKQHKQADPNRVIYELLLSALSSLPECRATGHVADLEHAGELEPRHRSFGEHDPTLPVPCSTGGPADVCASLPECEPFVRDAARVLDELAPSFSRVSGKIVYNNIQMNNPALSQLLSRAYQIPDIRTGITERVARSKLKEADARRASASLSAVKKALEEEGTDQQLVRELTRLGSSLSIG